LLQTKESVNHLISKDVTSKQASKLNKSLQQKVYMNTNSYVLCYGGRLAILHMHTAF